MSTRPAEKTAVCWYLRASIPDSGFRCIRFGDTEALTEDLSLSLAAGFEADVACKGMASPPFPSIPAISSSANEDDNGEQDPDPSSTQSSSLSEVDVSPAQLTNLASGDDFLGRYLSSFSGAKNERVDIAAMLPNDLSKEGRYQVM